MYDSPKPPDEEELAASRRAGFSHLWTVASDYQVIDGFLYERYPEARYIAPAGSPQLFSEVAKLHEGDSEAVLAFARRWGKLGWAEVARASVGSFDAYVEEVRKYQTRMPHETSLIGEPLPWIWAHARGIRVCLDVLRYLRLRDLDGLDRYLGPIRRPLGEDYPELMAVHIPFGAGHTIFDSQAGAIKGIEKEGWYIIWFIVNTNLVGIRHRLDMLDGAGVQVTRVYRGLIDVAYWQLAELAQDTQRVGVCEECGAIFRQEDRRQRFCPPPRWEDEGGQVHGPEESACAKKARMRRLRSREKERGKDA